jgi:hypothetical protein
MIVTAIGFSIFLYGLGFFTASTSARDVATQTNIATLQEGFVIVDCYFDIPGNTASIWVYNYGNTNLRISSIYLNASQLTTSSPTLPVLIVPANVTKIICTTTGVNAGNTQLIRVVSSLGNFNENYYKS